MQNQTLDLVAKLLANENINVVRAPVATAGFDIVGRTLVLPQWREMTPTIDQMLVAHEVGHALFTSTDYHDALDTTLRFKSAKSYLNILEDVRIEKLMKRRYPGLRKAFHTGYKELNDMDFFEVRGRDLASAHLLDRINLHFKLGYGLVRFTPEETVFTERAAALETIEETIQLTRDIYEFLKKQEEDRKSQPEADQGDAQPQPSEDENEGQDGESDRPIPEADDGDTDHSFKDLIDQPDEDPEEDTQTDGKGDVDSDEDDGEQQESEGDSETESEAQGDESDETDGEPGEGTTNKSTSDSDTELQDPDEGDDEIGPSTNQSFEDRVSELADTSTVYKYWDIEKCKFDPIVPHKVVNKTVQSMYNEPIGPLTVEKIRKFKRDTQNNVDYMVKEFEMRKAATTYKRSMTSKVGSLDMRKIWSYQLNDDLFKRVTSVQQGKNHGMVFLLDWSGSMHNVMNDTIDQVINLAMFCQRAGIAYQVFAFTDGVVTDSKKAYRTANPYDPNREPLSSIDVSGSTFALLELFSNKMSTADFNTSVNNLKSRRMERVYSLDGTPLNEALVYMYDYIGQFQRANNVEKVSFITLTDGQGGQLPSFLGNYEYDHTGTRRKARHFAKDKYTKKNFEISSDSSNQTNVLIDMIKARYNCTVLGFFITQNSRRQLYDALRAHYGHQMYTVESQNTIERMKSEFRTDGYSSLMNTGRDELFVIPTTSTKVKYEELEVDGTANARAIASRFSKYMTTKKTSRILLNKFIGYIA